jgi:very-short-patch-repair endonuclease
MNKLSFSKEWIEREYNILGRSFQDIAAELKTYTNAVRRRAIKLGIRPRDKSEAQALALKSSRHKHPTKGTKRSESVKIAISESVAKSWENLSDQEYEKRVKQGKQIWNSMSDEERILMQKKATSAIRKTSKEGSKLEKYIANHLKNQGFLIEFHKKRLLANDNLEVDIFLPDKNIAIEVDGPSHFREIWGWDALDKVQKADTEKNNLLLTYKINVIRLRQTKKNLSDKIMRDSVLAVETKINEIISTNQSAKVYIIEV